MRPQVMESHAVLRDVLRERASACVDCARIADWLERRIDALHDAAWCTSTQTTGSAVTQLAIAACVGATHLSRCALRGGTQ